MSDKLPEKDASSGKTIDDGSSIVLGVGVSRFSLPAPLPPPLSFKCWDGKQNTKRKQSQHSQRYYPCLSSAPGKQHRQPPMPLTFAQVVASCEQDKEECCDEDGNSPPTVVISLFSLRRLSCHFLASVVPGTWGAIGCFDNEDTDHSDDFARARM